MTNTDLVTIGRFMHVWEADLAKAFLENHGIASLVVDDDNSTVDPFAPVVYGGLKVQVRREKAEEASLLIQSVEFSSDDDLESEAAVPAKKVWPGRVMVLGAMIIAVAFLTLIFGVSTLADAWIWLVVGGLAWALGKHYPR